LATIRLAALLIALTVAMALASCGGSDSDATLTAAAPARKAASGLDKSVYVRRAEAICRRGVGRIRALGGRLPEIVSAAPSPQQGITSGLVGPGIAILSAEAAGLRGLGTPPPSPALETYLGLFDPILELARQRFQAGSAGDPGQAHQLELMVASLNEEQSAAAQKFGLRACSIAFNAALGGAG
jgi:hypothetical protein